MSFGIPVRNGLGIGLLASTSLATGNVGLPSPALSLTFAGATTLDPRITFSRPSLATLYDSTGVLTYAPNNLSLNSQNFSGAVWNISNFSRTTGQSDPFGGTGATLGTFTSNGGDGLFQNGLGLLSDKFYIISIYARFGTWRWFELTTVSGGATRSFVDMENGVAGNTAHSNFLVASVGNGWYRISAKVTGATEFYWTPRQTNGSSSAATTNNGATFYVYGFQAEAVTYQTTPSTYVATTSSAYYGPRFDHNPSTLAARGLLIEEARTNRALQSAMGTALGSWSGNLSTRTLSAEVAPDGTVSAMQIVTTGNAGLNLSQVITTVVGQTYTASMWLKGVSGQQIYFLAMDTAAGQELITFTGSWQRVTKVFTATATTSFIGCELFNRSGGASLPNVTFNAWGAQYELGAFATSYIPTGASSVARSADSVIMTGTNFSSWYNQSQGTFVTNFSRATTVANNWAYGLNVPSGIFDLVAGSTVVNFRYGASSADLQVSATFSSGKIATAYTANGTHALAINGGAVSTSSVTLDPGTPTFIRFGAEQGAGVGFLNGWIASINYYNTRLSDLTLQSLST